MMLGNSNSSTLITNSAAVDHHNGGGVGSGSGSGSGDAGTLPSGGGGGGFSDEDKARIEVGDSGGGGGNRWPRQETLELLRIRSEMEVAFRDSNLKGPLWEEVSRKMSQLGYRRNAKKCKEKFENVYKYHKRTKDGRASKSDGKTYRFFDQLEALEKNPNPNMSSLSSPQPSPLLLAPPPAPLRAPIPATTVITAVAVGSSTNNNPSAPAHVTVSSVPAAVTAAVAVNPVSFSPSLNNNPLFSSSPFSHPNPPPALNNPPQGYTSQSSHPNASSSYDQFTSSSTSSDEDIRRRSHKRKRKLKDYFEGMLHNMMEKQEEMHKKFLETLEKRDRDRMIREEAWRVQEMARMNRELDLLNQERAMAAAKDAAIAAFLQKYTGQENIKSPPTPSSNNAPQVQLSSPLPSQNSQPPPPPPPPIPISQIAIPTPTPPPALAPPPIPISQITTQAPVPPSSALVPPGPPPPAAPLPSRDSYALALSTRNDNGGENFMTPSSSRWPKTEVEALIKLRANMDLKYQDNCPKGPLWEEISSQMTKLGYNRSSKRCKEKWENINKYFKKVKESNKRRHEDSKTCPYFHQLDALYKEKAKTSSDPNNTHNQFQISYPNPIKPDTPVPIMARPEQQWPIQMHESSAMDDDEDHDSEHFDENDDVDEDDDERETEGGGHEMVTNQRQGSMSVATTTAAG